MRPTLLGLTAAAIVTASTLLASPAGAIDHRGVQSLTYHDSTDLCIEGQALPCTTNAGHGAANVLRIEQSTQPGGGLAFDEYTTTSLSPTHLWMAATIAAECKTGYKLSHAWVAPHYAYDQYKDDGTDEVQPGWAGIGLSVPDAKTMPTKKLALNIPVAEAFGPHGFIDDFDSLAEVYAYGEQRIDQRIADGMNEAEARSLPFQFQTWVITHAEVHCSGPSRTFIKKMPRYLPLTIQYVPVPQPTAGGRTHDGDGLVYQGADTGTNG